MTYYVTCQRSVPIYVGYRVSPGEWRAKRGATTITYCWNRNPVNTDLGGHEQETGRWLHRSRLPRSCSRSMQRSQPRDGAHPGRWEWRTPLRRSISSFTVMIEKRPVDL